MGALTRTRNKHLLPVGAEPMIFHPIHRLRGIGITEIMIVTGTEHMGAFVDELGSGKDLGVDLTYRVQDEAGGIAQAIGLAEGFARRSPIIVLLGDNLFQDSLIGLLHLLRRDSYGACTLLKKVSDPERYGVAEIAEYTNSLVSIEEKPQIGRA